MQYNQTMYYAYARVSTVGQSDASIDNQLKYLTIQAEQLGMPYTLLSEKQSGKDANRPVLQDILSKLQNGDVLGVYDNSRLSRNTSENLRLAQQIEDKGAKLQVNGKFIDINNPNDEMLLTIESAVSTYQRKNQNLKSRIGIETKKESGEWIFTSRMLGYQVTFVSGRPKVDVIESEAEMIRYIFNEYAKGKSILSITNQLNALGYRNRKGSQFSAATVRRYILKPIYMGYYLKEGGGPQKGQEKAKLTKDDLIKSNHYPPIVSEKLWWEVHASYIGLKRNHSQQFEYRFRYYPLSSLVKCEYGLTYSHSWEKRRNKIYEVYTVRQHKYGCNNSFHTLSADKYHHLFEYLFYSTYLWSTDIDSYLAQQTADLKQTIGDIDQRVRDIDKEITKAKSRQENLYTAVENGVSSAIERIKNIEEEIKQLEKIKHSLTVESTQSEMELEFKLSEYGEHLLEDFVRGGKRREIYLSLIKSATVRESVLYIEWVFGKDYRIPLYKNLGPKTQTIFEVHTDNNKLLFKIGPEGFISSGLISKRLDSIMEEVSVIGGQDGRSD